MKKVIVVIILIGVCCGAFLLVNQLNQPIKVAISGSEQLLFTITRQGEVEAELGLANLDFENFQTYGDAIETEKIILTEEDKAEIENLIFEVTKSKNVGEKNQRYTDVSQVKAQIRGKNFYSVYVTDVSKTHIKREYLNHELLNLTYKLLEISPYELKGGRFVKEETAN